MMAPPCYGATLGTSAGSPDPLSSFSSTTGLFSPASGAVGVSSTGTEKMRVTGTGVGIGTTAPGFPLHVYNNGVDTGYGLAGEEIYSSSFEAGLVLNNAATGGHKYNIFSSGGGSGVGNGNLAFADVTSQSTRMLISSSGNVGIGVTTPQSKLDVSGGAAVGASYAGVTAAPANGVIIQGPVGIGTNAPTVGAALDLSYNSNSMLLPVGTTGQRPTGVNGMVRYNSAIPGVETYYSGSWNTLGSGSGTVTPSSAGQVAYYQSTGGTVIGTSTMNIINGRVGIGTTTPRGKLHVAGGEFYFTNSDFVEFTTGSGLYMATGASSGDTYTEIQAFDAGNTQNYNLILQPFGSNVGIGLTSPGYTLHVNGSVAGTSAYVNTSDIRHKKNIQPLDAGLREIEQLRPVSFEWKDDILNRSIAGKIHRNPLDPSMQGKQIGFIAQDIEKILPSVVVTQDNDEKTKGMKYSELIPVLTKAIQEQQEEIQGQQAEINVLKQAVDRLDQKH